jgi:GT2 family glycosyltransferase
MAQSRLDEVFSADIEHADHQFPDGCCDTIVCDGSLGRVRDPLRLLKRARQWLAANGRLIASVPNVRHQSLLRSLIDGNWTYGSSPLLGADRTRLFTRREFEKLFYRADFTVREMRALPGPGYDEWVVRGRTGEVKVAQLHISGFTPQDAEEFYVDQFIVVAEPALKEDYGLTSIVIVTHNQVGYTRQCIDSIRERTDEPYELIVVDNGSTDGTVEWLKALREEVIGESRGRDAESAKSKSQRSDRNGPLGVTVITNSDNRGFPAAANQGIAAATGRQILLLNNDTVVTTGWLKRMLRALYSHPRIGLVGPLSNNVSGTQQVTVRYEDLEGLDGFAWDWAKTRDRIVSDTDRLIGFCLLIRREVIDKIGTLDERFGIGNFEDDDYCVRAMDAGYRLVIARDAFVHHFAGRTFVGAKIDFAALMAKNRKILREKLRAIALAKDGTPAGADQRSEKKLATNGKYRSRAASGGGLLLDRSRKRLSACIIMRDNERTIAACIESLKPWVDEIICVDTGSKDETPQIAVGWAPACFTFHGATVSPQRVMNRSSMRVANGSFGWTRTTRSTR